MEGGRCSRAFLHNSVVTPNLNACDVPARATLVPHGSRSFGSPPLRKEEQEAGSRLGESASTHNYFASNFDNNLTAGTPSSPFSHVSNQYFCLYRSHSGVFINPLPHNTFNPKVSSETDLNLDAIVLSWFNLGFRIWVRWVS